MIRLATPLQENQLLIIYCSPKRQVPGYLYKSPGAARGPSPQAKISWRGEEEAPEETPTTNHNSFSRVEASMSTEQEASSALEDLKRLIATSDWALGGLVVIGIFCFVFIALILFAAIFGCCTSRRHRQGGS